MSDHDIFGERRLRVSDLSPAVRRVIFTTYAILLALAVAAAVRERFAGHDVQTFVGYNLQSNVLLVGGALSTMAVALFLAGAGHARTKWRYLLVTPLFVALASGVLATPRSFVDKSVASQFNWLTFLPVPFLGAAAILVWIAPRLKATTALFVSLGLAFVYFTAVCIATISMHPAYGPSVILAAMAFATYGLTPALLVVGFDLAEIGSESSTLGLRITEASAAVATVMRWGLPAIGIAVAFAIHFGLGYETSNGWALSFVALLAITAAVVFGAMLRRSTPENAEHGKLGYLAVLCIAIALYVGQLLSGWVHEPRPGFLIYGGERNFSLRAPDGMQELFHRVSQSALDPGWVYAEFKTHGKAPSLSIMGVPRATPTIHSTQPRSVNDLIHEPRLPIMPMPKEKRFGKDGWWVGQTWVTPSKTTFNFVILHRPNNSLIASAAADWYIVCGGTTAQAKRIAKICYAAVRDFSTLIDSPAVRPSRPAAMVFSGLFLVAAAGALIWAALRRRANMLIDFLAWTFFLTAFRLSAGFTFRGVDDPLEDLKIAADLLASLLGILALVAVALAVWGDAAARRISTEAVGGALALAALFFLYVYAINQGDHSQAVRSVVIVLALTWELATSGPNLNPASEHHAFPRGSRVLIFVGYLILVAACVFTFGGSHFSSGEAIGAFDTEGIVASGIVMLGGALVMSRVLRNLATLYGPNAADPVVELVSSNVDSGHTALATE